MASTSTRKGKVGEREICKIFNARFADYLTAHPKAGDFCRTAGSGARGKQVQLGDRAGQFAGDIATPTGFLFSIENKFGYSLDLARTIVSGSALLDRWIDQAVADAVSVGRAPLIVWRGNRQVPFAFLYAELARSGGREIGNYLVYGRWLGLPLADLFQNRDNFFFGE